MNTTRIIPTSSVRSEALKNRFLAAIYQDRKLAPLFKETQALFSLTETDEKHLRQILAACKRFNKTTDNGFIKLQKRLRDRTRKTTAEYTGFKQWEAGLNLTDWQQQALFCHAITLQLTSGCSNYCRRCNEWALPRVRGHFTRNAVIKLLERLQRQGNNDLALYGGSDPLDWVDNGYDLGHVLNPAKAPVQFSILTKIPKGKHKLAATLVSSKIPVSVSLTSRNVSRIRKLEAAVGQKLPKQHATSDLLIPACLDEDFETIKPSITDSYGTEISTDGACIIIPAFTSALYPFGHKKIPITRGTLFFPVKKLGRPALLVDYFKPLEVEGPEGRYHLNGLLDVQVENILLDNGEYELTPPGMRSVKEYFEIFEDKARIQRKKMTISVIRRLKKEHLNGRRLTDLSGDEQKNYLDKIAAHLDFTRKEKVAAARVTAAAYFLAAVRQYLSVPTPKTDIIAHLTRKEYDHIKKAISPMETAQKLADLFSDPARDAWQLFRYHALSLVHENNPAAVDRFISKIQARFNPATDMFTNQAAD